ncbi:nitroreductase family protein [Candidatus Harpocratesius sp.]
MDFFEVISKRRSIRKYLNQPIPKNILSRILFAAQVAPSWAHKQGSRIIIVSQSDKVERLIDAIGQKWTESAVTFLVVCIDPEQSGIARNKMNYFPVDAAIIMEHLILAATNEGLGTCWIGWFDEDAVKSALSIPPKYRVIGITPIGYFEEDPPAKERLSLSKFCFKNEYGEPWDE